jgi:hypothetical protein
MQSLANFKYTSGLLTIKICHNSLEQPLIGISSREKFMDQYHQILEKLLAKVSF